MDANEALRNVNFRNTRKLNLRFTGIFFILGGVVFLIQGLFHVNDTIIGFIFLALVEVYALLIKDPSSGNRQTKPKYKVLRLLGWLALFLVVSAIVLLAWVWIWQRTGIPFSFLAAFSCGLMGLLLIFCSFFKVFTQPAAS